jgi:hypothetical protein
MTRNISLESVKALIQKVERYLPFMAVVACTIKAAAENGHKFFLHGRDMDAIAIAMERLWPELFESKAVVYEVTSRYWLENRLANNSYNARVAREHDLGTPRIHVDTGYSGSVPVALHKGGFNVAAIWLMGTSEATREMPLPADRQDFWVNPMGDAAGWGPDYLGMVARRKHIVGVAEDDFPHELSAPEFEQTWEKYLDGQTGNPMFWLFVKMIEAKVNVEWIYYRSAYDAHVKGLKIYRPAELEDRYRDFRWKQYDAKVVDAQEMPVGKWKPANNFCGYSGIQAALPEVLPEILSGLLWQECRLDKNTYYRAKIARRVWNGKLQESQLGRKLVSDELTMWQLKCRQVLEQIEKLAVGDCFQSKSHGGWLYWGKELDTYQPWLEVCPVFQTGMGSENLKRFKALKIPEASWEAAAKIGSECLCSACHMELYVNDNW